jgi:hypothetical protein
MLAARAALDEGQPEGGPLHLRDPRPDRAHALTRHHLQDPVHPQRRRRRNADQACSFILMN